MPSEVERVASRVDKLESKLAKLEVGGVSSDAPQLVKEIVVDTSKFEEHEQKTLNVLAQLESKLAAALDELSARVADIEHLKSIVSTVDGVTLHVELLNKHLSQLEEKVASLTVAPASEE
jgi:ubiquinone biosynthesis protein UbiJ